MSPDDELMQMYGEMLVALNKIESCGEFASIIPEVRSNMVYATRDAESEGDVIAIQGRITSVERSPRPAGRPALGASSHMARFIIGIMESYPNLRAGINLAYSDRLGEFLESYCDDRGWSFFGIDRAKEPDSAKESEGGSIPWKVGEVLRREREPKVVCETGAVGKEPVSVLLGETPVEVVDEVCALARAYRSKDHPARVGKVDNELLDQLIAGRLGAPNDHVIVPPRSGMDAGVIELNGEGVMVVAEDPVFSIPGLPTEFFGWAAVHIGASDVAVMGLSPQYLTYTLLLPTDTSDQELESLVDSIHSAARELGISIVGGHTGFLPGLETPLIGGITVFSVGDRADLITPAGASEGDVIVMTKGVAIEAAGVLAVVRREELVRELGREMVDRAADLCWEMTVVKDARIASSVEGVSAMHDATEGGLLGALYEISAASGIGIEIHESEIVVPEEVRAVCDTLGIDPLRSIAEGTLIVTVGPNHVDELIEAFNENGIQAAAIGKVLHGIERVMKRADGEVVTIEPSTSDPFWPAFFEALGI